MKYLQRYSLSSLDRVRNINGIENGDSLLGAEASGKGEPASDSLCTTVSLHGYLLK